MKKYLIYLFAVLLFAGCGLKNPFGDEKESKKLENLPPDTFLYLFVDQQQITEYDTVAVNGETKIIPRTYTTGLDTTPSKQIVRWWGDDPDGEVIGYYYQWDYQTERVFTTEEYDTFFVPIRQEYDEFSIRVWAIDNDSLVDPTPATLRFPVFNSPPEISFRLGSNPKVQNNPNVTSYTFPTRTFVWDAFDPDGQETITAIYYALDDTTSWTQLSSKLNQVTLTDIEPGEHRFYAKAQDVSGKFSNVIIFPDPEDPNVPNRWVVKPVKGDILLVNDFAQDQNLYEVQNFYRAILDELVGENGYSIWEIGTDMTPVINPQNAIPYSPIDIEANLSYFDKVIWFSYFGRPNISAAGLSFTRFMNNGGKLFISNGNEEVPDTTWTFTDIDSVYRLNPGGRLFPGVEILAGFGSGNDEELNLNLDRLVGNRVSALVPGPNADVVYFMEPDSTASVTVPYKGSPPVGVRYRLGSGESIYFSLPLHFCNGKSNMTNVFRYILFDEFNN